jgi:uncharacterized protein
MYRLTSLDILLLIILVIGGINWGLVGLLDFDLVAYLFGAMTVISRVVYGIVGLSALYTLYVIAKLTGKT